MQTNIEPRVLFHAKKSAFDQFCMSIFGQVPKNYDDNLMVVILDSTHPLNLLAKNPIKKSQNIHCFVSFEPINSLKFPRYAHLLNTQDGFIGSIEDLELFSQEYLVPVVVAGQDVKVLVKLYLGGILTEKSQNNSKPIDLKSFISEAQKNKDSKSESISPKEINFLTDLVDIYSKVGCADDQSYPVVIKDLQASAKQE